MTVDTSILRYEDPGERSDEVLVAIHRFAGLVPAPCPGISKRLSIQSWAMRCA